jgi:hypothetical protein
MQRQKAKGKRQKAKGGSGRLRRFRKIKRKNKVPTFCLLPFAFCLLLCCVAFCLLLFPVSAATSLEHYVQRVEEAAKLAADVVENDYSRDEETELLQRIIDLIPKTEDVARDQQGKDLTHVDNVWLQEAIEKLETEDDDERYAQLVTIADRLEALSRSLRAALEKQSTPTADAARERLQKILARQEYQPEEEKDSALQAWVKKIRQKINELLGRLFFGNSSQNLPGTGSLIAIRWLIILALLASLVWAIVLLLRRFQLREAKLPDNNLDEESREILGEQFDADVTADDLLKSAAEMAHKGEYRRAIRRAYLALLYDLEQRGKLRLHRAKTNRDYLSDLQREPNIYSPVSLLTNRYERVWYGDTTATMEDYAGFIEKFREVAQ